VATAAIGTRSTHHASVACSDMVCNIPLMTLDHFVMFRIHARQPAHNQVLMSNRAKTEISVVATL
jgi:hypothetical protein